VQRWASHDLGRIRDWNLRQSTLISGVAYSYKRRRLPSTRVVLWVKCCLAGQEASDEAPAAGSDRHAQPSAGHLDRTALGFEEAPQMRRLYHHTQ
jgi:hypothetical protein